MTHEEALERAVASLLDVVEELCQGLANGQTPEPAWADVVSSSFAAHRRERIEAEKAEPPTRLRT